jgi:two-component system, cell cycle response regulator DivK
VVLTAMSSQRSILIVDDKADLLDLFSASLRRLPYQVITAQDAETALDILKELTPLLIFLDLAMPSVSGIDVLQKVRADPRFSATKIVIVTAIPSRMDQKATSMVDRIIAKPVTPSMLEQAVIELIGQ